MNSFRNILATTPGIIVAGAFIGAAAVLLQYLGNPGNMGICIACFERDVAGGIGLHRAEIVQYLRPEVFGLCLGALLSSLFFGEFRPRGGSSPIVRFVLGMVAMIGALVFLGCPWRVILRLAGGDGNALFGLAGLIVGVGVGTLFFRKGFALGRSQGQSRMTGFMFPLLIVGLLILAVIFPFVPGQSRNGMVWYSLKGPGASHAPFLVSLILGALIGVIGQRSRFCTMGAFRDLILFRYGHLFLGVFTMLVVALIMNALILQQFHPGFTAQPVAHTDSVWNFGGMLVAGLAFALAGGCPGRQLLMAGEGDSDAAVFVLGMLAGAAVSHNFGLASSGAGVGQYGIPAVIIGFVLCLIIGFTHCKGNGGRA